MKKDEIILDKLALCEAVGRTARLASNALLVAHGYCPLSYRTVEPMDFKRAVLLFYERNNISAIKGIFMEQFQDAVNRYF